MSEYYWKNKERILSEAKQKVTCDCGATVNLGGLHHPNHTRSLRHRVWEEARSMPPITLFIPSLPMDTTEGATEDVNR